MNLLEKKPHKAFIESLYSMKDWKLRNRRFMQILAPEDIISENEAGILRIGKSNFENPKGWFNVDNVPPRDESKTYEEYTSLIPNFIDPFPDNVHEHDGILVVRDDLIPNNLGSKVRYAEALMQQVKEPYLFYAMVNSGQALKVLASTAKKYNKLVIGIAPLRKEPTESHVEAMKMGAVMLYYQTGGMAGARKRCRAFIHDHLQGNGLYIPAGVKHPYIVAGFAKSVNTIYNKYKPDVIFCACSTAVMAHGIMLGTPDSCEVHAVQVAGNSSLKKWPGRAVVYHHEQPFSDEVKKEDTAPFPSIPTYDSKAWIYCKKYKEANPNKKVLFWNVAGPVKLDV